MRKWLILLTLAGLCLPAAGRAQTVTVHADRALRGVPSRFLGANITSHGKIGSSPADFAPCCLDKLYNLARPLGLWRIPGGVLGSYFHFLTGAYDLDPDAPPSGVTLDGFVRAGANFGASYLLTLNWNARDQELLNLIDYANSPLPERIDSAWTETRFKQQEVAPKGYFPWLRLKRGRARPIGLRHVQLGNEPWNSFNDKDVRCNHNATCYGKESAILAELLKQVDPSLQVGVSILSHGQMKNPLYKNADIYKGWSELGRYPDFVFEHVYYRCGYGPGSAAQAEEMLRFGDSIAAPARKTREELVSAFPACGPHIGMFLDEVGPQACGDGPQPFEAFTPWAVGALLHTFAAALHAGYTHVSYYKWNGDPDDPERAGSGLASGRMPTVVDANYWGLWLMSRFLSDAVSEVEVTGTPEALRAFAVHAPGLVRLLVINTSASAESRLRIEVEGRKVRGSAALSYLADAAHGGFTNLFQRRTLVPQQPPAVRSPRLDGLEVPPLSTLLLEIDVGDALAPEVPAAATGCAPEHPRNQLPPDGGTGGDGGILPPPPDGCACRVASARPSGDLVFLCLGLLMIFARAVCRRARAR